jgi:xylulokinase
MLLLGIDVGTSFVKASVVDSQTQQILATASFPETEAPITALQPGWAEQSPQDWWQHVQQAILKLNASGEFNPKDISAIGIAYQMHGLVVVDKNQDLLRDSIIWCDSRAVSYGNNAFKQIGEEKCLSYLLNSPGNFTASKLAWVKENEPNVFERVDKIMLPGDYIAMKLSGEISSTVSALSEGVFWDFKNNKVSEEVLKAFQFAEALLPITRDVFSVHGCLKKDVAAYLGLQAGIPISYKAGDQPNNALSLNVLHPGEIAATAGTSGVIYAVTDKLHYDSQSRVNSFAHVNHKNGQNRIGVLLCINGAGIANKWIRNLSRHNHTYEQWNAEAANVPAGCDGVQMFPFGNGAERMLGNRVLGADISGVAFNRHTPAHLYRAAQEGIAFAFRYGLDIMRGVQIEPKVIRAGSSNMFLSRVFTEAFVSITDTPLQLYACDGSMGAALGAGIGAGIFSDAAQAFANFKPMQTVYPGNADSYNELYARWKNNLEAKLNAAG